MPKLVRKFATISTILASDVANAGTFTMGVPSPYTFDELEYLRSLVFPKNDFIIVDNNDKYTAIALAFSSNTITVTNNTGQTLKAGSKVSLSIDVPNFVIQALEFPIALAQITGNGDVVTNIRPGYAGEVLRLDAVVKNRVTTAAKLATLNAEINAVDVAGGTLGLTSANCATLGTVIQSSVVTGANVFGAKDTLSIEAAGVTAFAEGEVIARVLTRRYEVDAY